LSHRPAGEALAHPAADPPEVSARKIHGERIAPRAISAASQPVESNSRCASAAENTSPLPITGTRQTRFTSAIALQSAGSSLCCLPWRACTVR